MKIGPRDVRGGLVDRPVDGLSARAEPTEAEMAATLEHAVVTLEDLLSLR